MYELGALGLLARALVHHQKDARIVAQVQYQCLTISLLFLTVVVQVCTTLASLVVDENCGCALVENDYGIDGLTAVLEALKYVVLYWR
jgi:hypothetical protein